MSTVTDEIFELAFLACLLHQAHDRGEGMTLSPGEVATAMRGLDELYALRDRALELAHVAVDRIEALSAPEPSIAATFPALEKWRREVLESPHRTKLERAAAIHGETGRCLCGGELAEWPEGGA